MEKVSRTALYNAICIVLYIFLVSLVINNGDRIFGKMTGFVGSVAFLSLFTLSATIVGSLVLGKPLMLYLDNKKKEAISLFGQTVGWMAGFTVVLLVVLAVFK